MEFFERNWFWILLIGAFLWMHFKGHGCGGHSHGGHGKHGENPPGDRRDDDGAGKPPAHH